MNKLNLIGTWIFFQQFLKPNSEGSSLGVEKVEKPEDLEQARRKVIEFGEKMLLEKFVSGREFTCAVLQLGTLGISCPVTNCGGYCSRRELQFS